MPTRHQELTEEQVNTITIALASYKAKRSELTTSVDTRSDDPRAEDAVAFFHQENAKVQRDLDELLTLLDDAPIVTFTFDE